MSSLPKFFIGSLDRLLNPVLFCSTEKGISTYSIPENTSFTIVDKSGGRFAILMSSEKTHNTRKDDREIILLESKEEAEQDLASIKQILLSYFGWSEPESVDTQKSPKNNEQKPESILAETEDLLREIEEKASDSDLVDTHSIPQKKKRNKVLTTVGVAVSAISLILVGAFAINFKPYNKSPDFVTNATINNTVEPPVLTSEPAGYKRLEPAVPKQIVEKPEVPGFIKIASLPPAQYSWGFGNPKGTPLYVFSDPTCPACQTLTSQLRAVEKDYYIHVYPTNVIGGTKSDEIIQNLACSPNPAKSWDDWMTSGILDTKTELRKSCLEPALIVTNFNSKEFVANKFTSAPTIIREDGAVLQGTLPDDEFKMWLGAAGLQ
jgi:protein-disulfide isomerase